MEGRSVTRRWWMEEALDVSRILQAGYAIDRIRAEIHRAYTQ